ncbi:helix-turn-helix domain-containing protein [Haloarchaeobius amylolyticus]|uniref:helix-turn-helix domain-containing protein n=1 Tax=Haloarchaeobius amylolyticus TaxID=1198296 RepID=UPI00226DF706|nr:helix-turn-helix domain-containing protein [Haloarchaeobius amylolyticus]
MTGQDDATDEAEVLRLTLKVAHPDCWSLQVTDRHDGGLINHGAFPLAEGNIRGLFTAFGDTRAQVNDLVEATRASALTESVVELSSGLQTHAEGFDPGNATQDIFVEYSEEDSIEPALTSAGFIHEGPVRIYDGYEYWPVVAQCDRADLEERLATVRDRMDATIEVQHISSGRSHSGGSTQYLRLLSQRQREVFELARREGYYQWPREVSLQDLADELDISKTTFTEHLRKAEAKLLNDIR